MKVLQWLLAAIVLVPLHSLAQEAFPSRPISVIVPYAPGGAADLIARPLAQGLERELGQPAPVVNRAGASGAIGTQQCATAKPDGYTLCVAVVQISILPEVDVLFGRQPSYTRSQLTGLARLTAEPVVFMLGAGTPWRTLRDLVDAAKQQPGVIRYATGGNYAGNHLPVAMFAQAAGVNLLAVPYKGGGPSMTAALSGEVAMTAQVPGVAYPHVKSGKVRAVAHSGVKPLADFVGIPSLKDGGYEVEFYLWTGLFAPRDLPKHVMGVLRTGIRKTMSSDDMRSIAAKLRTELAFQDVEEFNKWWDQDAARLIEVVRRIGKIE